MPEDRKLRFVFTNVRLGSLPAAPAGKRITYYDDKRPGLCLRVSDKGTKSFIIYKKVSGRPRRKLIGNFPQLSVEQARKVCESEIGKLAIGVDIFAREQTDRAEPTLGELFTEYINRHASKKRKTADIMKQNFARTLGSWAKRRANSITVNDVERLHGKLATDRGPYTANRTMQLLRAIFNKAITWKLFDGDNPVRGITLFPERARERFLSADEVKKLFDALAQLPEGDDTRDFVMLCFLTGARKTNVLSMRWQDIDEQAGTWVIEETKNGTSQTIPLTGAEIVLLQQRKKILRNVHTALPAFVFPSKTSATGHIMDVKRSWDTLRKAAGIPDCTIHDLRRNLGSWMASENINVALIKSALHHKDMKTTLAVYARTATNSVRQGRETAHTAMLSAAGITPKRDNVEDLSTTTDIRTNRLLP